MAGVRLAERLVGPTRVTTTKQCPERERRNATVISYVSLEAIDFEIVDYH
jgi:hypothetical protein